jgi:hypothetical protein
MSAMSNLDYDIQELYIEGHSAKMIATLLDCPIDLVLGTLESMGVSDTTQDEEIYSPYFGA